MKRRIFLEKIGLGVPTACYGPELLQRWDVNGSLPKALSLDDCTDQEGRLAIRMAISSSEGIRTFEGRISATKGKVDAIKGYPFGTELQVVSNRQSFSGRVISFKSAVMVVWLDNWSRETRINIKINGESFDLKAGELSTDRTNEYSLSENINFNLNPLGYQEIGKITAASAGIQNRESFMCCLFADTQGGDPRDETNDSTTRVKIHNAFIEESIRLANQQDDPAFHMVIGDIVDSKGQWTNYQVLLNFLRRLKAPVLFSVGNHETAYNIDFTPGYNMSGFTNFFRAQSQMNGLEKLLYSFDIGQWHFIVWPDPLRTNFWEHHPHYFDWLQKDLENHRDRPTVFFHHVPLMPIGIDPLVSYVESPYVRNTLLEILSVHGNVKYAISGHVHIPVKASFKTAVEYEGIRFINLPAAGYRPRAFGEPDFKGAPSQGISCMYFDDRKARLKYITVTGDQFDYETANFSKGPGDQSLWDKPSCVLPLDSSIRNGNFQDGLNHWYQQYVYKEDKDPSNYMRAVQHQGKYALHLFSKARGFHVPGQDRLPQVINYLAQAVTVEKGNNPGFSLQIYPDSTEILKDSFNGIYIWIEGYSSCFKRVNLVYSFNKIYYNIGGKYADVQAVKPIHFDLPVLYDQWNHVMLNPGVDYRRKTGEDLASLDLDRIVFNIGSWTINKGEDQRAGAYITDVQYQADAAGDSFVEKMMLEEKENTDIWFGGIDHVAGEHIYKTKAQQDGS